jgi:protein tyrosine phosphatase (PTP) superfamily phosphohydrolase (DUF442 family)
VELEVTETPLGVKTVERSDDPATAGFLRSHAMGVSDFVRYGATASARETPRFNPDDPLPLPEVAIGGVPHRFILSQPSAAELGSMKSSGVTLVVNLRKPEETPSLDEKASVETGGAAYCNIPFQGAAGLTDEVLENARRAMRAADEHGDVAVLHCRTGNRVGAVWAAYRVFDKGVPVDQALHEARMMGTADELIARVKDYLTRQTQAQR